MASSSKKKTTMAKRDRENKLRERRLDKQAKKQARKLASSEQVDSPDAVLGTLNVEDVQPTPDEIAVDPIGETSASNGGRPARAPATEKAIEDLHP